MGVQLGSIMTGFEKVADAIFLETSDLRSKCFSLEIPELMSTNLGIDYNPNFIEIKSTI